MVELNGRCRGIGPGFCGWVVDAGTCGVAPADETVVFAAGGEGGFRTGLVGGGGF